jgi:photosystem II stability/assembly factor-like uncharacterized protein
VEIVGGGFVPGIVFSSRQPNLIYARTDIGGAYRWNASTQRWIPLTDGIGPADANLLGIESIAADPRDARRVYLAAGMYAQPWASNAAILRSTDQGRTWQRTAMPFQMGGNENGRSIGERLAIDPDQTRILYFGSRNDGLWKSTDYAVTWSKVQNFPVTSRTNGIGIGFVLFDARHSAPGQPTPTIYVGVAAPGVNLYRSTDAGATWTAVPGQPTRLLPHHGALASDGTLYLTYGNGPGPNNVTAGAVWKYDTDSGVWTDITPVKPGGESAGHCGYAGLTVDPAHPGTVLVSTLDRWNPGDDILRSTDGGKTWTALAAKAVRDSTAAPYLNWGSSSPRFGWWIGALALDPFHPTHLLYGTGATIWGTDDITNADHNQPTHWTVRAQGLEETAVIDLISPPAGAHLLSALGDIGGFRHEDLTVTPREGMASHPIFGSTTGLDFAEHDPALIVRVGTGEAQHGAYSTDGGKTWTPFATEPAGSRGSGAVAVSADGSVFVWALRFGAAYYSRDRGATWTACQGLPGRVRVVADRVNPVKFYALDAGKLYVSMDGGARFTVTSAVLPTERGRLRAMPDQEGDLWLMLGNTGVYHSTDSGASFTRLASVQTAESLGFGKAAPGRNFPALYLLGKVSGVQGIFRSDDAGETWVRINDDRHQYGGFGQTVIGDPRIYGRVYLGTNGRGILYADPVLKRVVVRRHRRDSPRDQY